MSRRSRQIARLRADHAARITQLTAAMARQARDWQAERRRLTDENTALRNALATTQQQLADAVYEPDQNARLEYGREWQSRREDKPRPHPEVAL